MARLRRTLSAFGLMVAALVSFAGGCSLTRHAASCDDNAQCKDAFGSGFVCGAEQLCELAPVHLSCTAQTPADLLMAPDKYKSYVIIGSLLRTEGKEGARHDAAELVIEAVNGYLEDHEDDFPELAELRFGMVQCNHDGSVENVAELAEYLVDTVQVPAILGPASSSATSSAFSSVNLDSDGTETRRALFISPSATSVALTGLERETPGLLWRTAPTDDGQGRLMGEYVVDTGTSFVVFYEDTPYGRGLYEELESAAGDLCDDCGLSFEADSSDVVPLTRMLASNAARDALEAAETVFFIGAQESHLNEMIQRLDSSQFAEKTMFFSDAAASADTVKEAADNVDRIIGTRPKAAEDGEATRFFTAAYEGRYDESPLIHSFTTHAYDATWLLLLSALHARMDGDDITPTSIAEGLRRMSDPDWTDRGPEECPVALEDDACPPLTLDQTYLTPILQSFEAFGTIDVRGASGSLDYDLDTEELANSADAFEFWYLQSETSDEVTIVGGTPPAP